LPCWAAKSPSGVPQAALKVPEKSLEQGAADASALVRIDGTWRCRSTPAALQLPRGRTWSAVEWWRSGHGGLVMRRSRVGIPKAAPWKPQDSLAVKWGFCFSVITPWSKRKCVDGAKMRPTRGRGWPQVPSGRLIGLGGSGDTGQAATTLRTLRRSSTRHPARTRTPPPRSQNSYKTRDPPPARIKAKLRDRAGRRVLMGGGSGVRSSGGWSMPDGSGYGW
jgi:hypothetical protein